MANPKADYNNTIRANLPSSIDYSEEKNRYITDQDEKFVTFKTANWQVNYLAATGNGPTTPAADFTYNGTLLVGVSGTTVGFRSYKYGQLDGGAAPVSWETVSFARILAYSPQETTATLQILSGSQLGSYTSLWIKFGTEDFQEMVYNGTNSYLQTDTASGLEIHTYLTANIGNTIDITIEARP